MIIRISQWIKWAVLAGALLAGAGASAQTNVPAASNAMAAAQHSDPAIAVRAEQLRGLCIQERRCICGRVLAVQTNGLVIDSGYANLLRNELKGNWHFPGTVVAARDPHLVEDQTPGSICVGQIFLTDLPRKRRAKVKINVYDYVVIEGYPAGEYTYISAEKLPHTVRRYACGLETAVKLRLASSGN
jgi:hypothetical protein